MEEGERRNSESSSQSRPRLTSTANEEPARSAKKMKISAEGNGNEGFANLAARMMTSKVKGQGAGKSGATDKNSGKDNGCMDDLPLGSEADSLGQNTATNMDSKFAVPEDRQSKWWRKNSQSIMGWQSFNSDVSNQTSASSASLEQLLNDRQVDPEEMLLSLGFGGEPQSLVPTLARVPERFLHHPSRAYGIAPPDVSEEVEGAAGDDSDVALPDKVAAAIPTASAMPPVKKRTGIWTLARTLSMLRMRTPVRGHISPSSNSSASQPQANQPVSILHPVNQRYLASRGFYEKQGWPKGSFPDPEEITEHATQETPEDKDAASKRRMFQKTRSRRNWSLCDSGENDAFSGGGEWVTKSVDSPSWEDVAGQDDSLGRGMYFSTTTESSTDSLDTPNLETERAFENIRREYNESRKAAHSSSDDLFMPNRQTRLSSDDENRDLDHGLDLLNTHLGSTNYFVSPASSRQTTVEKAPTISEQSLSINLADDVDSGKFHSLENNQDRTDYLEGDVRIVISSSDVSSGKVRPFVVNRGDIKSSKLTIEGVQRTSSDSGSSSGTTLIGGNSLIVTVDNHRRVSESENSVTECDSISRTNSPYGFIHDSGKKMVSSSCQTLDSDFLLVASVGQLVNVTTVTTSNRSLLHLHINKAGHMTPVQDSGLDVRGKEFGYIEQSPKVQLSTFPPTINHLELMKRLQQSQNDLSRMGSVQSDSSGFGDADPTTEPDNVKLSSLGSSAESCRTLASSATTVILSDKHREEMATQTSLDSSKVKTSREVVVEAGSSPQEVEHSQTYVTMCYIPTLPSKIDGLRYRSGHQQDDNSGFWRSRSGSDSRHVYRENYAQIRAGLSSDWSNDYTGSRTSKLHYVDSTKRSEKDKSCSRPLFKDSPDRIFTSHMNLYKTATGFSSKDVSGYRRHSDEGILEGRNNKPLSVELALARDVVSPPHSMPNSDKLTPAAASRNILSSPINLYSKISTPISRDSVTMTTPNQYITEAGFNSPPLAGNIRGFCKDLSNKPLNMNKLIFPNTSRQRSCDILDDNFEDRDLFGRMPSRTSDDLDTNSPVTEYSSDYSVQSLPEGATNSGVLESRKLARLINQPIYFKGSQRRGWSRYTPKHLFRDWNLLSKRKRLQEENRLLQNALQKYKTELTVMEASFMVDYQTIYLDITDEEREEVAELEWLWNEVKGQVIEMEHLLTTRLKAVHGGNEFFTLMSSLGIIKKMVELVKEQLCQHQMGSIRNDDDKDSSQDGEILDDMSYIDGRHGSFQSSHSWLAGRRVSTPRTFGRFQSSSTSNLPHDLNLSLEQMKSSVLSQVKQEIQENTKKLEQDLQEKDREIKQLQEQLLSKISSSEPQPKKWAPRSHRGIARSRSLKVGERTSHETDV